MSIRHFLDLNLLPAATLRSLVDTGLSLKRGALPYGRAPLGGKTLAMIFEKPSTRTRVSFEVAMLQLGGQAVVLGAHEMQLGRGETVADTARVLSRYVDAVMIRTNAHQKLLDLAEYGTIPVVNGLTDISHPCQVMADVMTIEDHRGPIAGKVITWCGDGNNVASSWIHAATKFGCTLRLACPATLGPDPVALEWARQNGGHIIVTTDMAEAVRDADCVMTDVWLSMGCTDETRKEKLLPYQVTEAMMDLAKPDALFMHCLPAHRNEEMTAGVIDGPWSVVWDQAENRLHIQKAILAWCLLGEAGK